MVDVAMHDTFTADRFQRLHVSLVDLSTVTARGLYQDLDRARPHFLNLLSTPPTSETERKEITAGTVNIKGVPNRVNQDFIKEALFLSQELGVGERFAAALLQCGMQSKARHDRPAAETALLVFHTERHFMLACLELIFKGALDDALEERGMRGLLEKYSVDILSEEVALGPGKGKGSLAEKVLVQIDSVQAEIAKQRAILTGAPALSTAVLPSTFSLGATSSVAKPVSATKLSDEMTSERIRCLRQERQGLGQILFLISYSRQLRKPEIIKTARWLAAAQPNDTLLVYVLISLLSSIETQI